MSDQPETPEKSLIHSHFFVDSTIPMLWTTYWQKNKVALVQLLVQMPWSSQGFQQTTEPKKKKRNSTVVLCVAFLAQQGTLHSTLLITVHQVYTGYLFFPSKEKRNEKKLILIKERKKKERFIHLKVDSPSFQMKMPILKTFSNT